MQNFVEMLLGEILHYQWWLILFQIEFLKIQITVDVFSFSENQHQADIGNAYDL